MEEVQPEPNSLYNISSGIKRKMDGFCATDINPFNENFHRLLKEDIGDTFTKQDMEALRIKL